MRTIAVCGSRHQDSYFTGLQRLFRLIDEAGFRTCVQRRFFNYLTGLGMKLPDMFCPADAPPAKAEAAISLGGDGTFLRTAQWIADRRIPILGINTGNLGFLAHSAITDAVPLVDALRDRSFVAEPRMLLRIECESMPEQIWPYALNEVAILKEDTSSMINVRTEINGYFLADYLADGLLIATPTGSTAYNLSAGGPILQPSLEGRVISPVAPHSLTMRPLVVDADSPITATTTSRAHTYRVSLDGRSFVMRCGSSIRITRAGFPVLMLRLPDDDFASTLRHKLHWAVR